MKDVEICSLIRARDVNLWIKITEERMAVPIVAHFWWFAQLVDAAKGGTHATCPDGTLLLEPCLKTVDEGQPERVPGIVFSAARQVSHPGVLEKLVLAELPNGFHHRVDHTLDKVLVPL